MSTHSFPSVFTWRDTHIDEERREKETETETETERETERDSYDRITNLVMRVLTLMTTSPNTITLDVKSSKYDWGRSIKPVIK
jgi:hypothetical protein